MKLKLTDERSETHYFNMIELNAVEAAKNSKVYPDMLNNFWEAENPAVPVKTYDFGSKKIISEITFKDQMYWKSGLRNLPETDYNDIIELSFIKDKNISEGTLLIDAVNTNLSSEVFNFLSDFLGENVLEFYNSVDNDPEMISIMKNWRTETSLKASYWSGEEWLDMGSVYPEANELPFSKAIHFSLGNVVSDTLRIRLQALADVWEIDAVQVEWGKNIPLKKKKLELLSASDKNGMDTRKLISNGDQLFKILLPGESINLVYENENSSAEKKTVFTLDVQGYLYEWFPEKAAAGMIGGAGIFEVPSRIEYLKNLLKHKSVFLTPVYAKWKRQ